MGVAAYSERVMSARIRFENVSKKYLLGQTRTSLPSVVSEWLARTIRNRSGPPPEDRVLWSLRDVSFDLDQGQSLALLGPNGAGKTTILKLLANITKPTSGRIETAGQLSALIELGAGFHPDLTGRENIFLNGTILGLSRKYIADRFDEIVDFSELERFIDTPVKRYSSGMIVRLGFAVASCIEPEILLVDEVLAVGDATFRQKCMQRIRSLMKGGTSIIFVSHNLYLVQAVCDRGLYLHKGQLQFLGTVDEAISVYEQRLHQERAEKFEIGDAEAAGSLDYDVEISRVEVLDGGGRPAEVLRSDEPARIQIHYHAFKSIGKAHASVFIMRSDGLTCCMMRTKISGVALHIERGSGMITVDLEPLQLISGTYYAEAHFLNETDSMELDAKSGRSDWFSVQGRFLSYEESSGVYEPLVSWEQRSLDNPHNHHAWAIDGIGSTIDAPGGSSGKKEKK